jgi:hypothetical protein
MAVETSDRNLMACKSRSGRRAGQEMARRFRRTPASTQVHPLVGETLKDPRDQA